MSNVAVNNSAIPGSSGLYDGGPHVGETKLNIREAIQGHRETLREFGDPIPVPSSLAGEVEITTAA